jgi:cytochrome c biogenesis protein CcmG/thiol:disulfide interchange protein DsbE
MSTRLKRAHASRSGTNILALVLVGAGLLIVGVVSLLLLSKPGRIGASESYASVVPVAVNFPAPDLKLTDIDGNENGIADYRGQVVLINNWATWCPPCRAEMPTLEAYFQDHRQEGFTLIGIEAGDAKDDVVEFASQYDLSFPIWLDPQNDSLRGFYNASLPNSYVIDRGGTVVLGWTGAISREMLEVHVTPLLEN